MNLQDQLGKLKVYTELSPDTQKKSEIHERIQFIKESKAPRASSLTLSLSSKGSVGDLQALYRTPVKSNQSKTFSFSSSQPKKKRKRKQKKDKENQLRGIGLNGNFVRDFSHADNSPRQFATVVSQIVTSNQISREESEESLGPNKERELYRSGKGNFSCDLCEKSFFCKKEYDAHSKTSIHKFLQTAEKKQPVEQSESLFKHYIPGVGYTLNEAERDALSRYDCEGGDF